MEVIEKYKIEYNELEEGSYEYEFIVDNLLFEYFENDDIKTAGLQVNITLTKKTHLLSMLFDISGVVGTECDRCLDIVDIPIDFQGNLHVKFGDDYAEESDEEIVVPRTDTSVNIGKFIYENVIISLPLRRAHPEGEAGNSDCNKEMLAKLKELSVESKEAENPMWDELKKLIN